MCGTVSRSRHAILGGPVFRGPGQRRLGAPSAVGRAELTHQGDQLGCSDSCRAVLVSYKGVHELVEQRLKAQRLRQQGVEGSGGSSSGGGAAGAPAGWRFSGGAGNWRCKQAHGTLRHATECKDGAAGAKR